MAHPLEWLLFFKLIVGEDVEKLEYLCIVLRM
jgi:hypothetical protein